MDIQANGSSQEELAESTEAIVSSPGSISELSEKMKIKGTVQRLELYGAFIDIGLDKPSILHISKLSKRVNRISDALTVGDEIEVWVESVDRDKGQVTVTMKPPLAVEWRDLQKGQVYQGKVTRLEKFGAFVDIGAEKEGLVHVSELSHEFIKHPSEATKAGQEIQVMVLGFSKQKRRIDLSHKAILEQPVDETKADEIEPDEEDEEEVPTAMEMALRQAMNENDDEESAAKVEDSTDGKSSANKRDEQDDILSRTLKLSQEAEG